MSATTLTIRPDGSVLLPAKARKQLGLKKGVRLEIVGCTAGILLRPVRPKPARYCKGRPVYTEAQLADMERTLPDESAWARELEREAKGRRKSN